MTIKNFYQKKQDGEKIVLITCYDYTSARLAAETDVDAVLVGDSVALTLYGFKDTLAATLPMMRRHTAAVSRGIGDKFLIADMPFLSYRQSFSKNVMAARRLIQAGAQAVKLENALGNLKLIQHLHESGVPVMGHLGLTPQFIHQLGGYTVQGKTTDSIARLQEDALRLQEAGAFALVLECIPPKVAQSITERLSIPTIGIGAGPFTDGQILVFHDLLGLNMDFKPKFVQAFCQGQDYLKNGIAAYVNAVKSGDYPQDAHCYGN